MPVDFEIESSKQRVWTIIFGQEGNKKSLAITETSPGKFEAPGLYSVDSEKLKAMHALLGQILMDLAAEIACSRSA